MFSGISPASLILILLIVVLIFGTKKLKGLGTDVGGAIKGFRKAMTDEEKAEAGQISSDDSGQGSESVKQSSDSSTHN
ncbi:MAG: twin-arginine translocase TatA/TatE family subunit [Gammaproteobacteria bacterium]